MRLFELRLLISLRLDRFPAGCYASVRDYLNVVGGLPVSHPYKLVRLAVKGFIKGGRNGGREG